MPRSRRSRYASDYQTLLELLNERRQAAAITQVELSERTGISQSMLSKLERGVVRMDLADLLDYLDGIEDDPMAFLKAYLSRIDWA